MKKTQTDRWAEDTMVVVSLDARRKLKMKALKQGKTLKQLLEEYSNE